MKNQTKLSNFTWHYLGSEFDNYGHEKFKTRRSDGQIKFLGLKYFKTYLDQGRIIGYPTNEKTKESLP